MAVAGAAKRYAHAAFDLARQQQALDAWERDLDRAVGVVQNPQVSEFFDSPAIPEEAKQLAITQLLPGEAERYVRNLLLLLLERRRLAQLPQVAEVFHDLVLQERGMAVAEVTTAVALTPQEAEQVRARLRDLIGKTVDMRARVDPAIIGGLVVRVGDDLIDGSVRTQLHQLRQRMAS